jgi:hypothetical protein
VPYEELKRAFAREGRPVPEIRLIASFDQPRQPIHFAGIRISEDIKPQIVMPWGFVIQVAPQIQDCRCKFNASIYDPATVRTAMAQWGRLAAVLASDPDLPIDQALALAKVTPVQLPELSSPSLLSRFLKRMTPVFSGGSNGAKV